MTSDPDFKVTTFFDVEYQKSKVKVTIAQEYVPSIWNDTKAYVWWPWLTSKRVARVCQHQLSLLCCVIGRMVYVVGDRWSICPYRGNTIADRSDTYIASVDLGSGFVKWLAILIKILESGSKSSMDSSPDSNKPLWTHSKSYRFLDKQRYRNRPIGQKTPIISTPCN